MGVYSDFEGVYSDFGVVHSDFGRVYSDFGGYIQILGIYSDLFFESSASAPPQNVIAQRKDISKIIRAKDPCII